MKYMPPTIKDSIASSNWIHKVKRNSYYLRSSHILHAVKPLIFSNVNGAIRFFNASESVELARLISRKNLFQRIPTSDQFYVKRAKDLSDSTIIEIYDPNIEFLINNSEIFSEWIEKVCILVYSLSNERRKIHKLLQVKKYNKTIFDLTIGRDFYYLRTKTRKISSPNGIPVDETFINRYKRCGFDRLETVCFMDDKIQNKIMGSINWLYESRIDPSIESAIVKTSIAIESLLIFSEHESLANSISERIAYLISNDLEIRMKISKYVKKFYNIRSGIVHGGRKKQRLPSLNILEGIDRLVILTNLILITNIDKWNNINDLET